jgi:gluconate 2-dehydrogenase gamma chain
MSEPSSRRQFLKSITALGAASLPASEGAGEPASATPPTRVPRHGAHVGRGTDADAYLFLNAPEAAFLDAALARLIPADDLGPGAREAGVTHFIDRELAGAFGAGARQYRAGPWPEGTPEQGFQSRLTPREIYRAAIAETDEYCRQHHGRPFSDLDDARRDEVLLGLESGTITLETYPAAQFFALLWSNTREGFFADPIYGGNRDKAGWRLVGFPGVAASYIDEIEKHGVAYRVEPVSIAEMRAGSVAVDAHGHPVHVPHRGGTGEP